MPDEPTPGTSGDNPAAEGQPTGDQQGPTPGETGDDKTYTKADLENILKGRLSKYADYDDLKSKLQELEDRDKTELEKVQKALSEKDQRVSSLETALREERAKSAVAAVATDLKFVNPGLAHRLVDLKSLEYDDDGHPSKKSVEAALKPLVESDPYLVGALKPRGDGGNGPRGPASGGEDMNSLLRRSAGRA